MLFWKKGRNTVQQHLLLESKQTASRDSGEVVFLCAEVFTES